MRAVGPATVVQEVPLSRSYGEFGLLESRAALAPFECRYLASFGNPPRLVELRVLSLSLQERGLHAEEVEARLADLRGIAHPYLARVAHSGVRDDCAFYVVDATSSVSLGDYLAGQRKGRLDPERAFDMLLPVGQAVATLHDQDLVHGDVSLRAIRVEEATERTYLGTYPLANLLGIPLPAPPFRELQATRAAGAVLDGPKATRSDDVRCFAAVLYEALTGNAVVPGSLPAPPSSRCALPPEADAILLQALAAQPGKRQASLREVLDGLAPLKAAVAEVAQAARGGRSRAMPAPDMDRRAGQDRRSKSQRQRDFEKLPFMDKLAVWLFEKGPAVNLLVFGLIALASYQNALLVPRPPEFMSGEFRSRAVSIASGKFDAVKIQDDLVQAAGMAASSPTTRMEYEPRLGAIRRFVKAIRKEDRDKVLSKKDLSRIRLTYPDEPKKAMALLDVHLKRAHEYLLEEEKQRGKSGGS